MARVKICSPRSLLPNICKIQIGTNSISSNLNSWHICMKVQEYVTEVLPSAHYVQIPRESQNTSHDTSSLLVHFMIPLSLLGNNPGPGNFVKIRWVCTRTCAPKFHVMADSKWGPVISSRHLAELHDTYLLRNTSQSIQLARNCWVWPYRTFVNKSAMFFLLGMRSTMASPTATASWTT